MESWLLVMCWWGGRTLAIQCCARKAELEGVIGMVAVALVCGGGYGPHQRGGVGHRMQRSLRDCEASGTICGCARLFYAIFLLLAPTTYLNLFGKPDNSICNLVPAVAGCCVCVAVKMFVFRCLFLRIVITHQAVVACVRTDGPGAKGLHRMPLVTNPQHLSTRQRGPRVHLGMGQSPVPSLMEEMQGATTGWTPAGRSPRCQVAEGCGADTWRKMGASGCVAGTPGE